MTTARRKEVLLKAWPDMPEPHRPDFEAYLRLGDEFKGANFRDAYMWPYINVSILLSLSLKQCVRSNGTLKFNDWILLRQCIMLT